MLAEAPSLPPRPDTPTPSSNLKVASVRFLVVRQITALRAEIIIPPHTPKPTPSLLLSPSQRMASPASQIPLHHSCLVLPLPPPSPAPGCPIHFTSCFSNPSTALSHVHMPKASAWFSPVSPVFPQSVQKLEWSAQGQL